jgi:hypothetical protein
MDVKANQLVSYQRFFVSLRLRVIGFASFHLSRYTKITVSKTPVLKQTENTGKCLKSQTFLKLANRALCQKSVLSQKRPGLFHNFGYRISLIFLTEKMKESGKMAARDEFPINLMFGFPAGS